jgi:hypothetical protein
MARVRDLEWPSTIPEEDWKEIEQGIPSKDEPFIKKYLDGQAALIAQEKKQRSGKLGGRAGERSLHIQIMAFDNPYPL